jgi:hypothetical protein
MHPKLQCFFRKKTAGGDDRHHPVNDDFITWWGDSGVGSIKKFGGSWVRGGNCCCGFSFCLFEREWFPYLIEKNRKGTAGPSLPMPRPGFSLYGDL